jgi:hypothetical protein
MFHIDVSVFALIMSLPGIDNVKNGSDRHLQDCLSDEGA